MAVRQLADRVLETSTTTGTGTFTLAGAVTGYRAFSVFADGDTVYYVIVAVDASSVPTGQWEVGLGTVGASGTTLARSTLISSSTGSAVNFSAGTKQVFVDLPSSERVLGPATAVDNAIVRFDGTTGKLIQDYTSGAPVVNDTGVLTMAVGTAALPSLNWGTANVGFYRDTNSATFVYWSAGTASGKLGQGQVGLVGNGFISWGNQTNTWASNADDLAIKRTAANILGVTNASTGGAAVDLTEMTAPSSAAANHLRIYAEDNGSSKTRLMVIFPSGVAQILATEP